MQDKIQKKFNALLGRDDILVLGLESSCDETAASVTRGRTVLSDVVASQTDIHALYGGVVPEIASRNHTLAFTAVIDEALKKANVGLGDLDAIAVTSRPGLIGCLLVGVSTAKALSFAKNIPLISVNHIEAHICANYANYAQIAGCENNAPENSANANNAPENNATANNATANNAPENNAPENNQINNIIANCAQDVKGAYVQNTLNPPFLALVASGGHTSIIDVADFNDYRLIGRTTDDAIGEAFDKVARLLGLSYPGGPNVDRLAKSGDPFAINFVKNKGVKKDYSLSYSGLKTAVVNYINQKRQKGEEINICDVCASFTRTAVDTLVDAAFKAADECGRGTIVVAGGVAANSYLRKTLTQRAAGRKIVIPPISLCTDNAVMVALRGFFAARDGQGLADLDLNAESVV